MTIAYSSQADRATLWIETADEGRTGPRQTRLASVRGKLTRQDAAPFVLANSSFQKHYFQYMRITPRDATIVLAARVAHRARREITDTA